MLSSGLLHPTAHAHVPLQPVLSLPETHFCLLHYYVLDHISWYVLRLKGTSQLQAFKVHVEILLSHLSNTQFNVSMPG